MPEVLKEKVKLLKSFFLLISCISFSLSPNNLLTVSFCIESLSSDLSSIAFCPSGFNSLKPRLVFFLDPQLFLFVFQTLFPKENK